MSQAMTPRERLMAAVSHRQPDRVPMDLGSTRDSSIVVEGYEKLKKHFGVAAENKIIDRMMRVVDVDERILKNLDIDTRAVFPGAPIKSQAQDLGPRKYRDLWGVERIQPESSYYFDQRQFPLSGKITLSDIARYPWPDPDDPGWVSGMKDRMKWIRGNTKCAAVLNLPSSFVHISQYLRGFEDWYCDFILHPKEMEALFDAVLEITTGISRHLLKEVGQEVDIVLCSDDLGAQNALQMSREHYLKYIKPRHAKFFRMIHEMSPGKLLLHSCGSVAAIIDDLIEIGVDILNPVQVSAAGMIPQELKKKYRGRMAFWGGTDSQKIFPQGTVPEVKKMVEDLIEDLGEGGGYVLSSCHNIQPDVPLENILTLFQHAKEYVPAFAR